MSLFLINCGSDSNGSASTLSCINDSKLFCNPITYSTPLSVDVAYQCCIDDANTEVVNSCPAQDFIYSCNVGADDKLIDLITSSTTYYYSGISSSKKQVEAQYELIHGPLSNSCNL